jgi:hypothetical protein
MVDFFGVYCNHSAAFARSGILRLFVEADATKKSGRNSPAPEMPVDFF